MQMRLWWVWVAAGCGGGVHSSRDAPFDIGGIKSGLWSVATASDDQYQSAILILSDEQAECSTIDDQPIDEAVDQLTRSGKGLWFLFDQTVADGGAVLEWTGTWTSDGSLPGSASWGSRDLAANAFETGVSYAITSDPSDWVRLDEVSADGVQGEFWTTWWRGSFKAEACGGWRGEDTTDSGTFDTGGTR